MGRATEKMRDYAERIAEQLGLDEPDYDDFDEVHDFIEENKDDYWRERREFSVCD